MVLVKNLRTSSEQSQACCPTEHKNKASRLEISEIITSVFKGQNLLSTTKVI